MAFKIENGVLKKYTEEKCCEECQCDYCEERQCEENGICEIYPYHGVYYFSDCAGKQYCPECSECEICLKYSVEGNITIPNSVTSIGDSAFSWCSNLTEINIPDSVTSIGDSAFKGCRSLTEINIPDSVTSIGESAFESCESLKSVKIGNSVTSIGERAFGWCSSLESVTIPDSVTNIRNDAFRGCKSLTEIIVSTNNKTYLSVDGVVYNKNITEIICCPCGKEKITIPDSVTNFKNVYFPDLNTVILPHSLEYINSEWFKNGGISYKEDYYNCTIELYGVKINLESLYDAYCITFDDEKYEMEVGWDKHQYADDTWEYYNGIADDVVYSIIKELNMILERDFGALKTKGYIYDENEEEQYDEDHPDYEKARLAMKDVYGIIIGMFNAYPDDEEILDYISENVMKFLPYILENATSEAIQKMLDNGKIFTKDNINEVLDYVIKNGKTEMNAVFLNYKHEHFGFDDPLKDFVL